MSNLTKLCLLLVGGAGVLATIDCAYVDCVCAEAPGHSDLRAAYCAAVADAVVAEQSEISGHLIPVLPKQRETRWTNIEGKDYVLTVTWASWDGYAGKVDSVMKLQQEVWATLVPQVREFCSELAVKDLNLRLEQLLGLPPGNGKTMFVEMWVKPDDLFRPCPDSEIDDNRCDLYFPHGTDIKHKEWFNHRRRTAYVGKNVHPWTRLGYTYDWGNSSGEVGLSEYVIRKGAMVRVGLPRVTRTYCAGAVRRSGLLARPEHDEGGNTAGVSGGLRRLAERAGWGRK